jgi:hypothetical protein
VSERPDGFLARWSRRKIEVRREEEQAPAPRPKEAQAPGAAAEPEAALTPEEIAALPKIEELTPEADLTAFLRKGVPEALKNAALRRMWSLDPAIRDYVGDARDYAYDWNVPGGVPGNGPLLPGDDVGAMMRQMFPEDGPGLDVADAPTVSTRLPSQVRDRAGPAADGDGAPAASHGGPGGEGAGDAHGPNALPPNAIGAPGDPGAAPLPASSGAEPAEKPPRRRHGGAMPV